MGARYDQPQSGRFTQLDPLPRSLISLNRYAYAGCNPANFTDPTGLTHCNANQKLGAGLTFVGGVAAAFGALALIPTGALTAGATTAVGLTLLGSALSAVGSEIIFLDCIHAG
jgi:uncharacterized protein RhaS with RHS repeats